MNPAEFLVLARTEANLWWFRGMRRILFDLLDRLAHGRRIARVLEAGCGTGYTADLVNQRYGWTVIAADLAAEAISLIPRSGGVLPVQADASLTPFASGAFDALLCLDVLVHFPEGEEAGALAEFARVLRSRGLLILRVSALKLLRSRHSQWTHERQRFTRTRLIDAVERRGFRVLRCTYANSLLLPVAAARFRIWEPLTRKPPASGTAPVPRWLDRLLYVPLAIERLLIRNSVPMPPGQTLILIAEKQE